MDRIKSLTLQITKLEEDYRSEIDMKKAEYQTIIELASDTLKHESERIFRQKAILLEQKRDFERDYREKLKDFITEENIATNLTQVSKVISKEIQESELPKNLLPLLNIFTKLVECNREELKNQTKFKLIKDKETAKLESITSTLKSTFELRFKDLSRQLNQAIEFEQCVFIDEDDD